MLLYGQRGIDAQSLNRGWGCIVGLWRKRVGDGVKAGDILFGYETDTVSLESEAAANGTLLKILACDRTAGVDTYPATRLAVTYDHKAVDSVPVLRFLQTLCVRAELFHMLLAL
jgi:pyruvate/2-oxoglutarate dehydrogenase complex dihydrolipoamide acyltransferase (E2) component